MQVPQNVLRCLKACTSNAIFAGVVAETPKRNANARQRLPRRRAKRERFRLQRGQLASRAPALRTSHSQARYPQTPEAHSPAAKGASTGAK